MLSKIMTTLLTISILASGCIEPPAQEIISSPIPEPVQIQSPPSKKVVPTSTAVPETQPEQAPTTTPAPIIDPDKIELKLDMNYNAAHNTADLSIFIANNHEFDLNDITIHFIQSGGSAPQQFIQKFNIPAGETTMRTLYGIRPRGEYWTDISCYIELGEKIVELTNCEKSWQ